MPPRQALNDKIFCRFVLYFNVCSIFLLFKYMLCVELLPRLRIFRYYANYLFGGVWAGYRFGFFAHFARFAVF